MKNKNKLYSIVLASVLMILMLTGIAGAAQESVLPYSFITAWGSYGSANGRFSYPTGVSVDFSGNVYVADTANNRIQKFDSSGTFLTCWGSIGSANGSFKYPGGVSVDSSGNVYVADTNNHRIQKFAQLSSVLPVANFSSNVSSGYAPLSVQFTDTSENATEWSWDFGDGSDSTEQNPVHTYSSAGNYTVNLTASNEEGTNSTFATITALEESVLPYSFITAWGSYGSANGSFSYPYGVSVDSSGNVYVADSDNHRIQKFDSSGTFLTTWGSSGSANGSFDSPRGVSVDSSGNVYVADRNNHRIQKFDSSGTFLTTWGSYGSANGSFSYPAGIAVDSSGNVYVVDYYNHRIQKFAQPSSVLPVANFSSNVSSGYAPLSVQFTDISENATEWSWDFGDGSNSTIQSPTHVFYAAGNYTVTLTASNENGTDSIESVINVTAAPVFPVADFSSNVSSGYAPLTVQFNDSSENATGWIWDFGEGNNSTVQNPVHTYSAAGNYSVNLTVSNQDGISSKLANITVLDYSPAYTIEKTVTDVAGNGASANVTKAGDVISYRINVTNAGNIDLTNVSVVDSLINLTVPSESLNTDSVLEVGEFWTYTGNYTVTQEDLNNNGGGDGFINNTATVNCTELTEGTGSVAVPIVQNPAYTIEKTVTDVSGNGSSANVTKAGDVISYRINVTNAGNLDLTNVSVVDSLINLTVPSESLNSDGILGVGEFWTYTGNYTVTQTDLNSNGGGDGFINNTATVNCTELTVENDSVSVPIVQNPAYTIEKTVTDVSGNGASANVTKAGDVISYRINVTNAGNLDLTNVSVVDSLINLTVPSESLNTDSVLEVGEFWTYTGNYTVTQADLNSNGGGDGFINNTATVNCTELTVENDSVAVPIVQNPAYTIEKTVTDVAGNGSSANVTKAGDVISYRINVTNAGNIDLTNVSVVDSLINLTGPSGDNSQANILNVGESWIFLGNYTVTQSDLNSNGGGDGFINNTATVNCTELTGETDSVAVPIVQNPVCSIKKIVVDIAGDGPQGNISSAGDLIQFQVNVTNNGNIDLSNISISDSLINLTGPYGDTVLFQLARSVKTVQYPLGGDGILSVGETWYYLGNYTVTQEDLNNNGGGDGFLNSTVTFESSETEPISSSTIQYINDSGNESGDIGPGIYIERNPKCSIYKSVLEVVNGEDGAVNDAGDIVRYSILVTNEGNVELTGVSVTDPMISLVGPVESLNTDGVLEVGENWTYTGNYTVTQEDMDSNGGGDGDIDNTAVISCNELSNKTSSVEVQLIAPEVSGSGSGHGSGTGSASVISVTEENNELNENTAEENVTKIQLEEETEYVEENTGNNTVKPGAADEETTDKNTSKSGVIYWGVGLLVAGSFVVYLYKRRYDEQK